MNSQPRKAVTPKRTIILLAIACLMGVVPLNADIIAINNVGASTNSVFPGQSVTTPGGGPWSNLVFNWFGPGLSEEAAGTLYLLSQPYLGSPAALSNAVPGFIAAAGAVGDAYTFAPSVTLDPLTTYFFFNSQVLTISGNGDTYAGGNGYGAFSAAGSFFSSPAEDINFRLQGTAIPEPSSVVLLISAVGISAWMCRRKSRLAR